MNERPVPRPTGTRGLQVHGLALDAASRCLQLLNGVSAPGDLADQLRRAVTGMCLNIAEGAGRSGRDRVHHFRIAYGSAQESRTAIALMQATGSLESGNASAVLELLDRVCAMLWRLMG